MLTGLLEVHEIFFVEAKFLTEGRIFTFILLAFPINAPFKVFAKLIFEALILILRASGLVFAGVDGMVFGLVAFFCYGSTAELILGFFIDDESFTLMLNLVFNSNKVFFIFDAVYGAVIGTESVFLNNFLIIFFSESGCFLTCTVLKSVGLCIFIDKMYANV